MRTSIYPVGIGILTYHKPEETQRLVQSIVDNTPADQYRICIWDNTDHGKTVLNSWFESSAASLPPIALLSSGVNVGCSVARNNLWQYFARMYPTMRYMVVFDQDIVVRQGWLEAMLEVAEQHTNAGQVVWPLFNMARDQPDAEGKIHDVAGGASLYRIDAIAAIQGWDSRFFFFRFDSWFTLKLYAAGWYTYLITKYCQPKTDWAHWLDDYGGVAEIACGPISHVNPSCGTKRHPNYTKIREASQRLFDLLLRSHNLLDLYTNWPNHKKLPHEKA